MAVTIQKRKLSSGPRRAGAPKGNRNARKHGRYANNQRLLATDPLENFLRRFHRIARRRCGAKSRSKYYRADVVWDPVRADLDLAGIRRSLPVILKDAGHARYRKHFILGAKKALDEIRPHALGYRDKNNVLDTICCISLQAENKAGEHCDTSEAFLAFAIGWRWFCAFYWSDMTGQSLSKPAKFNAP